MVVLSRKAVDKQCGNGRFSLSPRSGNKGVGAGGDDGGRVCEREGKESIGCGGRRRELVLNVVKCKRRSEGDCTHRRSSLPPFPADSQSRSPLLSLTPTRFRWPKRLSLTVAALTSIPCSRPSHPPHPSL
ncbi:hypothetical protein Pmani_036196 [Petrolisthes manimaculis]|uniref:Uncharacterized protein n=1 Tax=Petrolisthes manimaculis TaxID=1843537 RepID=A0AAE1TMN1_9EUCA|nr:hypothetical protein Pmani_036196 [Petrolisthes manimaculis]